MKQTKNWKENKKKKKIQILMKKINNIIFLLFYDESPFTHRRQMFAFFGDASCSYRDLIVRLSYKSLLQSHELERIYIYTHPTWCICGFLISIKLVYLAFGAVEKSPIFALIRWGFQGNRKNCVFMRRTLVRSSHSCRLKRLSY